MVLTSCSVAHCFHHGNRDRGMVSHHSTRPLYFLGHHKCRSGVHCSHRQHSGAVGTCGSTCAGVCQIFAESELQQVWPITSYLCSTVSVWLRRGAGPVCFVRRAFLKFICSQQASKMEGALLFNLPLGIVFQGDH